MTQAKTVIDFREVHESWSCLTLVASLWFQWWQLGCNFFVVGTVKRWTNITESINTRWDFNSLRTLCPGLHLGSLECSRNPDLDLWRVAVVEWNSVWKSRCW